MYLEKKGHRKPRTLFYPSRNLWKWRAFWYREPLYQNENKTTVSVEPPIQHNRVIIDCALSQASVWSKSSTLRKIILRQTTWSYYHDRYWEVIEFCDPRIQSIKKTIEEIFDIEITNHSYIYTELRKTNIRNWNLKKKQLTNRGSTKKFNTIK
jgi:Fur family ferric uptake transcriptional regulator